jgi:hypothetical protein
VAHSLSVLRRIIPCLLVLAATPVGAHALSSTQTSGPIPASVAAPAYRTSATTASANNAILTKMRLPNEAGFLDDALGRVFLPLSRIQSATVWSILPGDKTKRIEVEVRNGQPTHLVYHIGLFGEVWWDEWREYSDSGLTHIRIETNPTYRSREDSESEFFYDEQGRLEMTRIRRGTIDVFSAQCVYTKGSAVITTIDTIDEKQQPVCQSRWRLECSGDRLLSEWLGVEDQPERCVRRLEYDASGQLRSEETFGASGLESVSLFDRESTSGAWEKVARGDRDGKRLSDCVTLFDSQRNLVQSTLWRYGVASCNSPANGQPTTRVCQVRDFLEGQWLSDWTTSSQENGVTEQSLYTFERDARGSIIGRRRWIYDHATASVSEDVERMEIELHYVK